MVVLGPSGSGKTTLLNLVAGFEPCHHGQISLEGKPVTGPGAERGVVFQSEGLLPWRNVRDNVALGLQLAGVPSAERTEQAQALLRQVGLEGPAIAPSGSSPAANASGSASPGPGHPAPPAPAGRALRRPGRLHPGADADSAAAPVARAPASGAAHHPRHRGRPSSWPPIWCCSPLPGRVTERLTLDFGRRFAAGEPCRSIKSDPAFIERREYVLERVFAEREAFA